MLNSDLSNPIWTDTATLYKELTFTQCVQELKNMMTISKSKRGKVKFACKSL